jgi:hypothetical protein
MRTRYLRTALVSGLGIAAAGALAVPAAAEMRVEPINDHLCKVTGGGKFVDIPGFPGEKIDKRLRPDIRWMKRKYKIFITDGYARSGHSPNGEHPIGLALDIIPARDGGWGLIDKLAERFEPRQNSVRPPMRWVGYDGDYNHGRGHHLHLSYSWSDPNRQNGKPVKTVYTRVCPGQGDGGGDGSGGGGTGDGGVEPRKSGSMTQAEINALAPVVPETAEHDGHDH